MLKVMLLSLLVSTALFGGLLDFRTLKKAEEAYANKQYSEAAAFYESIDDKNDDLRYNLGDAYYKAKRYDDALKQYEQVHKSELQAKTLHNMGNAYANTKKIDEAIAAYEEALKIGDDEDTKFNLELLKKEKEQQEKQEKNEENKGQEKEKEDQNKNKDEQESGDDESKDQTPDEESDKEKDDQQSDQEKNDEQSDRERDNQQSDSKSEQEKKEKQAKEDEASKNDEKENDDMNQGEAKKEPISDMQERKYEKMLEKRGIKTLMVPLKTEGKPHEETTAW